MELTFTPVTACPPLAWLARCRGDAALVAHGSRVETRPGWFAEAAWDGDFAAGDLDRTDLVFGSGGRVRGGGLTFVSSATTVDRLHSAEARGCTWVSNSLAYLLAATGAALAPDYPNYFRDFETVIHGTAAYRRDLGGSAVPVRLTYYDNLRWEGGRLTVAAKPYPRRDLGTFERYRDFVESALCRLADNLRSEQRAHPYELLATVSSGYDSPAVAALARRAGLRQTLSFSRARDGRPDSGAEVARRLGLEPVVVDSGAWRELPLAEVPFLAADSKGEDVYYAAAADVLRGRVLLTGYGGSRVWDKGPAPSEHLERSDQSGLSLCEYRLGAGFLHCPVTYFGGRQTADLRRLSNSPDMAAWDVPGGYSRPICRRILEEAGVPRDLFGREKKAASILFFDRHSFLSPASRADYERWLRATLGRSAGGGAGLAEGVRVTVRGLQKAAGALGAVVHSRLLRRIGRSGKLSQFVNYEPLFRHVFPWAMEHARRRYPGG